MPDVNVSTGKSASTETRTQDSNREPASGAVPRTNQGTPPTSEQNLDPEPPTHRYHTTAEWSLGIIAGLEPGDPRLQFLRRHIEQSILDEGVPIRGFSRHTQRKSTPSEPHDTELQKDLIPAELSEGQQLFLCLAYLFDMLLTQRHGDWQGILNDENDRLSEGYFINGRLRINAITKKITDEIPPGLGGATPGKTTEKHVNLAVKCLSQGQAHIVDLSAQGKPKAYRTLFGLAIAAWRAKRKPPYPKIADCEYPPNKFKELAEGLTSSEHDVLATCLENARQQVIRQSQALVTQPE